MEIELVYSVREAALLLKKSMSWVYRSVDNGAIAAAEVGSSLRIPRSEILRLLKPTNAAAVEAWARKQLNNRDRQEERAFIKDIDRRYSVANMKRPTGEPPCR